MTRDSTLHKIVTIEELVVERERHRAAGERVVFTNGCFDLLHPGHVRYLTQARGLGDVLIIGLNSDRSVRELKGPQRPILRAEERAEVMAALACVDLVTIFDQLTPLELITRVRPDILVKGGDWGIEAIVGKREVEEEGGVVLSLPFVDGCSTTEVIGRIVDRYGADSDRRRYTDGTGE
ncbi:MAG: D-glycero-beta-D-manno-heptose 1-phosphate adenylyltransferase [Blastocatellia bacterium]